MSNIAGIEDMKGKQPLGLVTTEVMDDLGNSSLRRVVMIKFLLEQVEERIEGKE